MIVGATQYVVTVVGGDCVSPIPPTTLDRMRAKFRRRWVPLTVGVVMTGVTVNAWIQAGTRVMAILLLILIAYIVVWMFTGVTATKAVVQHVAHPKRQVEAQRVRIQIEAAEGKR
jgi:multisubunit Na+/H+ antiporter MnhE subunit